MQENGSKENKLNIILEKTIGLTVNKISNDFLNKEITIYFDNDKSITFSDCAFVYDLGIIGVCIGEYSDDAGLGMKLELNKFTENSEDYMFCSLSRDFKDFKNKNEIRISFKQINTDL